MGHHYNVAPRYTPGSPALVSREIAERVAKEETHFIQHAMEGAWGAEHQARAGRLGLAGIVELRVERRDHWEVTDLCTGERFKRLFPEKIRKLGFRGYCDLETWEKALVDEKPPVMEDYRTKGWFKIEIDFVNGYFSGYRVVMYEPEPING